MSQEPTLQELLEFQLESNKALEKKLGVSIIGLLGFLLIFTWNASARVTNIDNNISQLSADVKDTKEQIKPLASIPDRVLTLEHVVFGERRGK